MNHFLPLTNINVIILIIEIHLIQVLMPNLAKLPVVFQDFLQKMILLTQLIEIIFINLGLSYQK